VEAALLFNEKKYPPMLPRVLRVVRAKAVRKTALAYSASRPDSRNTRNPNKSQIYNPKISSEISSLKGRASKLLGKAGAAQFKKHEGSASGANEMVIGKRGDGVNGDRRSSGTGIGGVMKTPESIVFEGYRASAKAGKPKDLKFGGGGKKKGKPAKRGTTRAAEWRKKSGVKKGK